MDTSLDDIIIRARLIVPRPRRYVLPRPALDDRLRAAQRYRLTVVQAGTGFGKTTALVAALREAPLDVFWYTLAEDERDAALFLAHLVHAFRARWPEIGEHALRWLYEAKATPHVHRRVVEMLSNDLMAHSARDAVLVLDDYEFVNAVPEIGALVDHFVDLLPPQLHLVIATRHRPALANLVRWRAKGDLLEVSQRDLAFSPDEIESLFRLEYGLRLSAAQVQRLSALTEGWAIALRMIWQSVQSGAAAGLDQTLADLPRSLEDLFVYLAQEVLARRPVPVQEFLVQTAVLRRLEPAACDHLLSRTDSAALLASLDDEGFFLVRLGDAYRYHHVFHDFLRQRAAAQPERTRSLHRRAAEYYGACGDVENAVHHYLAAADYETAAETLVGVAPALVRDGRFDMLSQCVGALPPGVLARFPALLLQMGELSRFASRFDEALAWYEQAKRGYLQQRDIAGASRALRGQAAIYLDTVRPIKAESLLQEALRLVDGQPDREERARLLELLAENMTNRGRSEEAAALERQGRELREEGPGPDDLDVRVLLRTGRLDQARALLEERAAEERREEHFREPRAHRESLLVLSLIYAFQGMAQESFATAREGIALGRRLNSPFVEAVGYMRLGHAWQLSWHPAATGRALDCYRRAIEIGDRLAVPRLKVEAEWGLCRLYGFTGDLAAAEQSAREGREAALAAGDEWIAALLDLSLGAAYVLAGHAEPAGLWLERAARVMRECGDPFGQTAALLWLARLQHRFDSPRLEATLEQLLGLQSAHGYGFLFERRTFLGANDAAVLVPLLLVARGMEGCASRASALLDRRRLPADLDFHPGYTLRVYALGPFKMLRGAEPAGDDEWRREKARHLLQFLLANRRRYVERDEIAEALWPGADTLVADQQFKVALNALQHVLEPRRPPRAPGLFVQRRGTAYRLDPAAMWLDVDLFERLLAQADAAQDHALALDLYRECLDLYRGDFLTESAYADWCRGERERLRQRCLDASTRAAEVLLAAHAARDGREAPDPDPAAASELAEAVSIAERALVVDPCWEPACRVLIRALLRRREPAQALRAYERCVAALREELDVAPAPETEALGSEARRASPAAGGGPQATGSGRA